MWVDLSASSSGTCGRAAGLSTLGPASTTLRASTVLEISDYSPALSDECVALERVCPQGERFRLSFRRPTFHARAATYERWGLVVGREGGRLVATCAYALRPAILHGETRTTAFGFDLRVHPDLRQRGIAGRMTRAVIERATPQGADLFYTQVVGDNRAMFGVCRSLRMTLAGGYRTLVWPVFRRRGARAAPETTPAQIHDAYVRAEGPFDFHPIPGPAPAGHVVSLTTGAAGCSLWSNEALLAEVVERVPPAYRAARLALAAPPLRWLPLPRVPAPGEALRSWFVYDLHAADGHAARALLEHVNDRALASGIGYCYVVVSGEPSWWPELRAAAPPLLSPIIPYSLLMTDLRGPLRVPARMCVDARDL